MNLVFLKNKFKKKGFVKSEYGEKTQKVEINNTFVIVEVLDKEVDWQKQYGINIALPHNLSNPYDYEDMKTNSITSNEIMWRWVHTKADSLINEMIGGFFSHTYSQVAFESLEWGPTFQRKNDVLNDIKDSIKQYGKNNIKFYEKLKVGKVELIAEYNDSQNDFERVLRCLGYRLTGIQNSKILKPKVTFKAKGIYHDYTEYMVPKSDFKKFFKW
jgi:hypothetical protein